MRILLSFLFVLFLFISHSQINKDSLKSVWLDTKVPDTTRLDALNKMIYKGYVKEQPDSALYFIDIAMDFAKEHDLTRRLGSSYQYKAKAYTAKKNYQKALEEYEKCKEIWEKIHYVKGIVAVHNNLGSVYLKLNQNRKAFSHFLISLKQVESIGDTRF